MTEMTPPSTRGHALRAWVTFVLLLASAPMAHAEKRIYIANDDHTDYFWTADDATYRDSFLYMLDFYMAQAEATAANPPDSRGRFNADGSLWVWEYEHNKTPAEFSRLVGHLRAGDITMPLNTAVLCYGGSPAEAVLRSMYYAGRLERRYDLRFPLVVAMENQTLPGGIASLWAGAGAKYSWRGVCGCATKTTFAPRPREIYWFDGPDGQGVCMKWNTLTNTASQIGGYYEAADPAGIVNYLDTNSAFQSVWPWDVSAAFGYGGDVLESSTSQFVNASLQMSNASRRVIVSNEVDFFQDFVANHGSEIPTFSGSFGNEWELYQASMGAVTAAFRRGIERLRTAEALATIAALVDPAFMNGRATARDAAFMAAGLYYEHDWTADGPVPAERRAQFQRDQLAKLEAYVNPLLADALAALAGHVRGAAGVERHVVFNPLSWSRDDVVDLATSVAEPRHVVDVATGAEVPSQSVSASSVRILATAVPSVGYRVYAVLPGAAAARPAAATVSLPSFDNGLYGVTLGTRGNLPSLVDHRDADRELAYTGTGGTLNDLGLGDGPVTLESTGPVSTTLRVDATTALPHVTRVTLYAGVDRVDVENTITANFSGTTEYASRFALTGAVVRHEEVGMIARAAQAAAGGDYADQNMRVDYLSFGHFADLSEPTRGVTVSNADCSFFRLGNSLPGELYTDVPRIRAIVGMQVDGPSYGIADQGGDSWFLNRFAFRRHGAYDPAAAMRFALEHQNPLVEATVTGGGSAPMPAGPWSLVSLPSNDVLLWALKPAEDGIASGIVARVWNMADGPRPLSLSLPPLPQFHATRTTHLETDLSAASVANGVLTDGLARQQMATYRLVPEGQLLDTVPAVVPPGLALSVFPNPIAHGTAAGVAFRIGAPGRVVVRVLDLRGAVVATLCDEARPAGEQRFAWDRHDAHGRRSAAGVYFVDVRTPEGRSQRRIVALD